MNIMDFIEKWKVSPTRMAFFIDCIGIVLCVFLLNGSLRAEEPVAIRVQNLPNSNSTSPEGIAEQRVIAAFHRKYPAIELVPAEGLRVAGLVNEATTIMMIAGGIAPDVISMNFRSLDTFVRQGMVLPLDELLAEQPDGGAAIRERIAPQVLPVAERTGPEGIKHLYGLPTPLQVRGLFFNRELFRQAGLPDRAPADWNELLDFSRRLKEYNKGRPGLLLSAGSSASWDLIGFLWSAGGEAVSEIAPNEWRAVFNSPEAVKGYEYYYQLVEFERVALRGSFGMLSPQDKERIAMRFGYIGNTAGFNPESWGFGPIPMGPGGLQSSEINAVILGIYSGVKSPAVRDAAWKYIEFVTSAEAERIRVGTFIEMGMASQVNPVALRKHGGSRYLELAPPGLEEKVALALRDGKPEPFGKNCNLVYTEMTYPLDRILLSPTIRKNWDAGEMEAVRKEIRAVLDRAVVKTNERMIGYVAPEEMARRRTVAAIVLAAVVLLFSFVGWYVARVFSQSSAIMPQTVSGRSVLPWLCLLPAAGLILTWDYLPLIRGTKMVFLDYQIILKSTFVGLDNFADALYDAAFWNSLLATLHFAGWTLTLGFAAPILLAYGLHLIPRHKVLFRILYYLPAVISSTAVFFLWLELFSAEGVMNQILRAFGMEARRAWTEDPTFAMLSCIIPGVWAGAGPGCLIYLAALKTIPVEQMEAAEIDGAGLWHKTWLIVLPGLKALIFINFIGAVAGAFHGSSNIIIMTGGGPDGATEVTSLLIFYEAFTRLRFGPATAMAWILGSMLIGFTVLKLKRLSQMEFKAGT